MFYYFGPQDEDWNPDDYYGENDYDEDADDADEYEDDSGSAEDQNIEWDGKYTPGS